MSLATLTSSLFGCLDACMPAPCLHTRQLFVGSGLTHCKLDVKQHPAMVLQQAERVKHLMGCSALALDVCHLVNTCSTTLLPDFVMAHTPGCLLYRAKHPKLLSDPLCQPSFRPEPQAQVPNPQQASPRMRPQRPLALHLQPETQPVRVS